MDGILLIDKPGGMTSHDVVSWLRRTLGQRRIGHAGTLDPMATGLLVMLIGKATRLASLLTASDKTYEATVRLGQATTTDDAEGEPIGQFVEPPGDEAIEAALAAFRGTFAQQPPAYSAKKISGTRAYKLARQARPVDLPPVEVTIHELSWQGRTGVDVRLRVRSSAGFYVRSLARDLGHRLGCAGHLAALRRVRSGAFHVDEAWTLAQVEASPSAAIGRLVSPAAALPDLPAVEVTPAGLLRVQHGNFVAPDHIVGPLPAAPAEADIPVRILSEGRLIALARARGAALHPVVVLG